MKDINENFLRKANEIAREIIKRNNFLVVSHYDADGVSACAIIIDLLKNLKKDVDFRIIKQLDSTTIDEFKNSRDKTIIFTDMGSGQISLIEKSGIGDFFILDHHMPEKENERQLNPMFYGYDGGLEISGSGVAYMVARALNFRNMAHIAVVGSVGDMQDSQGKLESLNRVIAMDAINEGTLKIEKDIRLFGRQSRPLAQMLAYASDPLLPGICGDETAAFNFLQNLGIKLKRDDGLWKHYIDLNKEEKEKIISGIYMYLLDCDVPEYIIQGIFGEVYTLLKEEERTELRDAKEFATLLNACGRQNSSETGVYICLGDRKEYLKKAKNLLEKHRKALRQGITYMKEKGVSGMSHLYYFDASGIIDENIIGVISGMGYGAKIFPPDKPIISFADDKDNESMAKVSARANWSLVREGIHLGNALRVASRFIGGEGGGHNIAAGAKIPKDKKGKFLEKLNEIFKEQISKKIRKCNLYS